MTEKPKVQPKFKYRAGSMSISIFENKGKTGDKDFTYNTFSLQRSYKDKEGKWENPSLSLRLNDLQKAILSLQKAYDYAVSSKEASEDSEDEE